MAQSGQNRPSLSLSAIGAKADMAKAGHHVKPQVSPRRLTLLRPRCYRPRSRATQHTEKFPPPHDPPKGSGTRHRNGLAERSGRANVRFGSKADVTTAIPPKADIRRMHTNAPPHGGSADGNGFEPAMHGASPPTWLQVQITTMTFSRNRRAPRSLPLYAPRGCSEEEQRIFAAWGCLLQPQNGHGRPADRPRSLHPNHFHHGLS